MFGTKKYRAEQVAELVRTERAEAERHFSEITIRLSNIEREQRREMAQAMDGKIKIAMQESFHEGVRRGFSIARKSRFTDTINDIAAPPFDIFAAIRPGRDIARGLQQNNPYGQRLIEDSKVKVIGPRGYKLQWDVRNDDDTADELANKFLLNKFNDFAKMENASVAGDMSFRMIQQFLYADSKRRDGEGLCREHASGKYGIQLQPLDVELLDETYTTDLSNGNMVIMGVEVDKQWRRIAYYLRGTKVTASGFGYIAATQERERVPAEQIYHLFKRSYMRQTRGVTEFCSIAIMLKAFMKWVESSTNNAVSGAQLFGFLVNKLQAPTPGITNSLDTKKSDGTKQDQPADGSKIMNIEDQTIRELPHGWEFQGMDAKFPHEQDEPFRRSMLRGMAVGWGSAYSTVSGDYSQANYSSERAAQLDIREFYKNEQEDFREAFLDRFIPRWLKAAALSGQLAFPSGKMLPVFSNWEKFNKAIWIPRRWAWVDPLKDVVASITAIDAGLTSATQVVSDQGEELMDIYNDLSDEQKLRLKKGIVLKSDLEKLMLLSKSAPDPAKREESAREFLRSMLKVVTELEESERTNDETTNERATENLIALAKKLTNGHSHLVEL